MGIVVMDVEGLGGGAIVKLYRFINNVKNFGSLSMMGKLRTVATPTVPLALLGGGYMFTAAEATNLTKMLDMGPQQQVMMQSCIDNHNEVYVEFGYNVSTAMGCACTAKLVSSVTPPAHYSAYSELHMFNMEQWNWEYEAESEGAQKLEYESKLTAGLKELAKTSGVNVKGLRHMNDYVNTAETICDMRESYKGESGESLVALKPLETPIWESSNEGEVQISLRGAEAPITVSMK